MMRKTAVFSVAFVTAMCGALWVAEASQRSVVTTKIPEPIEMSGGGGHSGGCSGCFCCFPRTPGGNLHFNGFVPVAKGTETVVFETPQDKWFMLTDLEVVVLDDHGSATSSFQVGLYEEDAMGMRKLLRWSNCSPYHSARGIAIRPGCDVILGELAGVLPTHGETAQQFYFQLNGYLWDGATTSH